jgi:hypothetical protein
MEGNLKYNEHSIYRTTSHYIDVSVIPVFLSSLPQASVSPLSDELLALAND